MAWYTKTWNSKIIYLISFLLCSKETKFREENFWYLLVIEIVPNIKWLVVRIIIYQIFPYQFHPHIHLYFINEIISGDKQFLVEFFIKPITITAFMILGEEVEKEVFISLWFTLLSIVWQMFNFFCLLCNVHVVFTPPSHPSYSKQV